MRERIAAAFVVLAISVLFAAGAVRSVTIRDLLREQDVTQLRHEAALTLQLVTQRAESGEPVDKRFLAGIVEPGARLTYRGEAGEVITVRGPSYAGGPEEDITATASNDAGTVKLAMEAKVVGYVFQRNWGSIVTLFFMIGLLAGLAGWIAARMLASPFQKLAVAASALGRGRFDLELPKTRIPEARAIARSLETSALQLESRISQERAFAEHASHVLRTPLTSLRLELEDLTLRDDVPDDAKAAAVRCMTSVDNVNTSAGELVALARRGSLVEGAEVPLHELARQISQRWADRLADERRQVSASAEGDLDMAFTPGPVEHVLDLVLSDIVLGGSRTVDITFLGEHGHLKVCLPAGVIANGSRRRRRRQPGAGVEAARAAAEAQGGRVSGNGTDEDLEVLLPRR